MREAIEQAIAAGTRAIERGVGAGDEILARNYTAAHWARFALGAGIHPSSDTFQWMGGTYRRVGPGHFQLVEG